MIDSARRDGHVLDQAVIVDTIPTASNLPLWKIVNKVMYTHTHDVKGCPYMLTIHCTVCDII